MIPRPGDYADLVRQDAVLPLDGYAERFGWTERIVAPARAVGTRGGRLFGLPRSLETMGLFFDASLLRTMPHDRRAREQRERMAAGLQPFAYRLVLRMAAEPALDGPVARRPAWGGGRPRRGDRGSGRLRSWFDRGWFGNSYFTDTIGGAFARRPHRRPRRMGPGSSTPPARSSAIVSATSLSHHFPTSRRMPYHATCWEPRAHAFHRSRRRSHCPRRAVQCSDPTPLRPTSGSGRGPGCSAARDRYGYATAPARSHETFLKPIEPDQRQRRRADERAPSLMRRSRAGAFFNRHGVI